MAGPAGEERLEALGSSIISKTVVVSNCFACPVWGENTKLSKERPVGGTVSEASKAAAAFPRLDGAVL